MNVLLDIHILLWFISGDNRLPRNLIDIINSPSNSCFVSIASIWEIAIKYSLDKLEIKSGFNIIEQFFEHSEIKIIPIDLSDIKNLLNLEHHHRDPFDRIIIAQAISNNLDIITIDKDFKNYPIKLLNPT